MASSLNEDSVEKKLRTVINTQDSIQSLSLWIIHHKNHHTKIVELWMKVLKKTVQPLHRLTLFYLCNDVVQTCKKKKAYVYNASFKECLKEAAALVRDNSVKNKVERIFNIWGERGVYDHAFVKSLQSVLSGQPVKPQKTPKLFEEDEIGNAPVSPIITPQIEFPAKEETTESHQSENMIERDAEESARILAEFKPHEMIDQITAFRRQEVEIQLKVSQMSHMKLDASNIEAVKQLKDRAHGNDYSNQFEDSCTKLEDLIKRKSRIVEDQNALIETLSLSETFYEEQYREAKIVANAYKNFGARINNMKKKLDELKRSMPEPDSPIPSPDMNAPSPGNTPPYVSDTGYGYNPAAPMNYGQGLKQKSWAYNGTDSVVGSSMISTGAQDNNTFQDSPPLEAPSPEGSPPDLNLDGSENASVSLESRLASFFDRNRPGTSNPPVYTPQLARSVVSSNKLKLLDDDGSTTPLDDEAPTTPVQDENLVSPPKRSTPPKKENPIDFLSRLITQTQKAPAKTAAPSFLDSLAMLTSATKKPDTDSQQQAANPQSWAAWKLKSNENNTPASQPSSPLSYVPTSSLPTSTTHYPSTPTMVPPPVPMPVPPPVSLSMGMNMPPPPPPPFGLASVISTNFSTPPPAFQQTSPGQKENWPDMKPGQSADHTSSTRAPHNSVLKELVPADDMDAKPGPRLSKESSTSSTMDPDAMEMVSDEEGDEKQEPKSAESTVDAKAEFAQKLKQKTSVGVIKSHVFVPNPERPNLMTLTVSDDLDESDMNDDDAVLEEAPGWSNKSHKSSHRSRSRSPSRDKDRSHKHKKKKKHKRNHGSDEDSRLSAADDDDDSKGISSIGSVVKKIDSHVSRNSRDSNKGEKYDEKYDDRKYDKYDDDRKYDRYDERGYSGRGDNRSHKNYKGSKDVKDPVEAYTQAYRDAFFQQYNMGRFNLFPTAPPPMDPRRSGYGKY
uniref:Regulation of nuclear pre-mRNA domain-containing protein 2 n=1 Tax=Arion vulgaris TaxID=1028688 RepID=A0A0B6ZY11_9EUPU